MSSESALQQILESGLLGALLVVSLFSIGYLYREVNKERTGRLEDLKEVWKGDIEFRQEIKQTLQNILELLRGK